MQLRFFPRGSGNARLAKDDRKKSDPDVAAARVLSREAEPSEQREVAGLKGGEPLQDTIRVARLKNERGKGVETVQLRR